MTIAASLILIGTALLVGWWFWSLHQASIRVDEDLVKGEREMQQLRSVLAQVQKFESSKAQLQQRVTLIEQLRRGQGGPVHILDEISKAVPERLWLTDMTQKGDDIVLAGMTTSLTGTVGLCRQPRRQHLVQEAGRHRRQPGDDRSEERRHLQVLGQGRVQQPGRAAASAAAGRRERSWRAAGEEVGLHVRKG